MSQCLKNILTKEILYQKYIVEQKSTLQIAKELGIKSYNSISQYLKKFNLTRPSIKIISNFIPRDALYQKYIVENKSLKIIAQEFGLARKALTIKNLLIKYEIPVRTRTYASPTQINDWNRRKHNHQIAGKYWYSVVSAAKKRGYAFKITRDFAWELFLKQKGKCAYSGVELKFKELTESSIAQTASLDRKDNSKGYLKSNVQWVHKTVNKMKSTLPHKEFVKFCKLIAQNQQV